MSNLFSFLNIEISLATLKASIKIPCFRAELESLERVGIIIEDYSLAKRKICFNIHHLHLY